MSLCVQCPDCAAAFPTVYGQVLPHYGPDKLYFVLHLFPLPYHLMAFTVAQSALVVQNINGTDAAALAWSNWMFANQDKYENNGTMSTTQVTSMLAADVQSVMGISQAQFLQGMNDPDLNENTRIGWKYGCSRGTTGTPNFMVNGLQVAADETWTLSDWEQLLDPLYQTAEERKASRAKAREQRSGC